MTYIYIEYGSIGRTLHKPGGLTCSVKNDAEKAAALADGWSLLPVPDAPEPAAPQDEAPAEAAPVEDAAPKKRGRKARG